MPHDIVKPLMSVGTESPSTYRHVSSKRSNTTNYHRNRCKISAYIRPSHYASTTLLNPLRATSGVGFGICRRLLHGLAQHIPEDARPVFPGSGGADNDKASGLEYPCSGLTLIMACRSQQRAEAARKELFKLFEHDVAPLRATPGGAERIVAFHSNLVVSVHLLDLASVQSTLAFADEVART